MKILLGIFIPLIVIILLVLLFVFRERIPLFKRFCYKDVFVDDDEPALPSIEYYNAPGCTVPSKIPPPIPIKEFAASLEELNSKSEFPVLFKTVEGLAKAEIEDKYRLTKHVAENNRPRNRYMDVLPYDQSLVLVGRPWSTASSDPEPRFTFEQVSEGYINASYVRRPEYGAGGEALVASVTSLPEYIATQGPLESTAADFLTMVCEQRSPLIIMLCQCTDGNREKCAQYWPDGVTQTFHSVGRRVEVKKESEGLSGSVIRRQLKIRPMSEKFPWIVTQVQFTAWIDHNVPNMESLYSLIAMQNSVLAKHHVGDEYGPTIVHCSAGAGRTGTFMAAVFLLDRLRKNPQNVDIIGTVLAMRKWRADLVQAWSQLQFLYNFTNFCLIKEQRGTRRPAPVAKSLPSVEYMNSGEAPYLPAMQPGLPPLPARRNKKEPTLTNGEAEPSNCPQL